MGKLKLILLRDDVDTGDMQVVDETVMTDEPALRVGTWPETKNDIKVIYSGRQPIEGIVS